VKISNIRFDIDKSPSRASAPNLNEKIIASISCDFCELFLKTKLYDSTMRPVVDSLGMPIEPLFFEVGSMFGGRLLTVRGSLSTIQFAFSSVTYQSTQNAHTDTLKLNITRVWNAVLGDFNTVIYNSASSLASVLVHVTVPIDPPLVVMNAATVSGPLKTFIDLNVKLLPDDRDGNDTYSFTVASSLGTVVGKWDHLSLSCRCSMPF
jgi:hypothetical protein